MRAAVAVTLACVLAAQPAVAGRPAPQPPPGSVEALGVSFERIKRGLRLQAPSAASAASPLKLDYYVEVMAPAPEIRIFTPADLMALGPVPGAPPTHREMIRDLWTKPEFKGQSMPIGSLAIMGIMKLAQWQAEQIKQRKKEEARRKETEELRKKYPDLIVR